jgi:hypothetical protein
VCEKRILTGNEENVCMSLARKFELAATLINMECYEKVSTENIEE